MAEKPMPMSIVAAVERELKLLARRDKALAESGLAAAALAMAREIDTDGNSATSKSMCARVMVDALEKLRELAPEEEKADRLDDLSAKRARRIGGTTA